MKSFRQIGLVMGLMLFLVACVHTSTPKVKEAISEEDVAKTQQALDSPKIVVKEPISKDDVAKTQLALEPAEIVVVKGPIGKSMSEDDVAKTQQALEQAEIVQRQEWTNPDTRKRYTVRISRIYTNDQGQECREYAIVAIANLKRDEMTSKACRQANNSWKTIN